MNGKITRVVCLLSWTVTLFVTNQASAQTTANGPYYPMPAWDQTVACATRATCPRFIVLSNMNSAAVLDRETGLVWEKSPNSTITFDWFTAHRYCNDLILGNRLGWRLPTIQELASLVDGDLANTSSPRLPPGNPFSNVSPVVGYWSANTYSAFTGNAWFLIFGDGSVGTGTKAAVIHFWCVRGGHGVDPQ